MEYLTLSPKVQTDAYADLMTPTVVVLRSRFDVSGGFLPAQIRGVVLSCSNKLLASTFQAATFQASNLLASRLALF